MSASDWIDTGIPTARIATLALAAPAALAVAPLAITWADGARAGRTEIIDVMPIIGAAPCQRLDPAVCDTSRAVGRADRR